MELSERAEELPTERTGRVETEEGFRGTRLLMGGLPSLVESLSAHAVQSGFVPPISASSNGSVVANAPTAAENVKMETTFSREVSNEPMVTEPSALEQQQQQQRVTERTSAEGSADSHPDRSMVEDQVSSDMEIIIEQDAAGKNNLKGRS